MGGCRFKANIHLTHTQPETTGPPADPHSTYKPPTKLLRRCDTWRGVKTHLEGGCNRRNPHGNETVNGGGSGPAPSDPAHDVALVSLPMPFTLIAYSPLQPTAELLGRVVSDGDTIDVPDDAKTTNRIRLAGIDAPEPAQPFSRQHLSECCCGKDVTVRVLGKDKHGRIIGHVSVNGDAACLSLLQAGLAWHYLIYDQSPEYAAAAKRGLDPRPIPPWD